MSDIRRAGTDPRFSYATRSRQAPERAHLVWGTVLRTTTCGSDPRTSEWRPLPTRIRSSDTRSATSGDHHTADSDNPTTVAPCHPRVSRASHVSAENPPEQTSTRDLTSRSTSAENEAMTLLPWRRAVASGLASVAGHLVVTAGIAVVAVVWGYWMLLLIAAVELSARCGCTRSSGAPKQPPSPTSRADVNRDLRERLPCGPRFTPWSPATHGPVIPAALPDPHPTRGRRLGQCPSEGRCAGRRPGGPATRWVAHYRRGCLVRASEHNGDSLAGDLLPQDERLAESAASPCSATRRPGSPYARKRSVWLSLVQ